MCRLVFSAALGLYGRVVMMLDAVLVLPAIAAAATPPGHITPIGLDASRRMENND